MQKKRTNPYEILEKLTKQLDPDLVTAKRQELCRNCLHTVKGTDRCIYPMLPLTKDLDDCPYFSPENLII